MASVQAAPRRPALAGRCGGRAAAVHVASARVARTRRDAVAVATAWARRVGAFVAWWLAMDAIVATAFALAFALCAIF